MDIDPIAATGGAASKMPIEADAAAQSHAAVDSGAQQTSPAVGSSETINLFDYASQQGDRSLPMDALSAEGKAEHFANPTTLGEEVLNYLEGFHKRAADYQPFSERMAAEQQSTSTAMLTPNGPASTMPNQTSSLSAVGSTGADQANGTASEMHFETVLEVMQEAGMRHTETNLVSNIGQQFSKAMNTLMRGQ